MSAKEIMLKGFARSRKTASIAIQDRILSLHNRWAKKKMKRVLKEGSKIGAAISFDDIKVYEMPVCASCLKGT